MKNKTSRAGDNAGVFPDENSVKDYLNGENNRTTLDYHQDRLRVFKLLLEKIDLPKKVLDFGCGNGIYIYEFWKPADLEQLVGVDIYQSMLDEFSSNLQDFPCKVVKGGPESLRAISGDCRLSA